MKIIRPAYYVGIGKEDPTLEHLPRPLLAAGVGGGAMGPSGGAGPSGGVPGGAGPPGAVGPSGGGGRAGPSGGGAAESEGLVQDAHREAVECISEARQAVEDEREHFKEVSVLARNELGEFHQLAVDAMKGLVNNFDRHLKGTVIQLQSYLQRGIKSSSLCTRLAYNPACKE